LEVPAPFRRVILLNRFPRIGVEPALGNVLCMRFKFFLKAADYLSQVSRKSERENESKRMKETEIGTSDAKNSIAVCSPYPNTASGLKKG
jgi:hypothetical protein